MSRTRLIIFMAALLLLSCSVFGCQCYYDCLVSDAIGASHLSALEIEDYGLRRHEDYDPPW